MSAIEVPEIDKPISDPLSLPGPEVNLGPDEINETDSIDPTLPVDPNIMDMTMISSALDPDIQDTIDAEEDDDTNGDEGNDANGDDDNDDDDDDDDDIKITIGEIKATTPPYSAGSNYTPLNFTLGKRGPAFGPGGQVTSNTGAKTRTAGLNVDAVGTYEGQSIYEFNLDNIEEKPWRKPGADITDYFNYGFTEETWKIYCEKQKKIQQEIASGISLNGDTIKRRSNPIGGDRGLTGINANGNQAIPHSSQGPKGPNMGPSQANSESPIPVTSFNENSKYSGMGLSKKAGPPPGRKPSGTIDVIGGGTPSTPSVITSRRPPDTPDNSFNQMMSTVPPGPGIPPSPFHYPPPPFGIPPPHAGMEFLPPHPIGPRGISPSVMASVPPSTSYPPPHIMGEYGMMMPIKREREDDRDDRDRREKDDRDERDKREREERERRDKRREREERDKRDRRDREKHIKKERRDDRDRDREERDKRETLRRRSDREKSERRHRDEKDEREDKHESKKRKKSESETRDREEREKRERRERDEKEKKER